MAEIPWYLQGTQTAGLLGYQDPMQSYIPSIPGTQPQSYTPGYGEPLYADQTQNDAQLARNQAVSQLQEQLMQQGLSPEQAFIQANSQVGSLSTFSGQQDGSVPQQTSATGDSPLTVVGQEGGWMSPEQLRAGTEGIQTRGGPNIGSTEGSTAETSGRSTGGTTSSGGSTSSGGLNLNNTVGGAGQQGSSPSFGNMQFPSNTPLNYQAPQGQLNQFQSPGGQPGQQQGGALQMQQANPQAALQQYQNTPGYQLLGNNQAQQFQESPGYQYAVDQALKQVGQQASARGLLGSGAALRSMTDRAQGMASQEYGNWWNRQNQLYSDYQNRLAGLAGGPTGAEQANQLGQNLGAGSMQMGSNLGTLFGNQGNIGMGGIVNTGAAQANAMTQAGNQQAQILGANQATQLAGAVAGQRGLF